MLFYFLEDDSILVRELNAIESLPIFIVNWLSNIDLSAIFLYDEYILRYVDFIM